jgi:hypothetical protein
VSSVLLLAVPPASAQTTGSYSAPAEFMDLFFDFTGIGEPGYLAGQPTLGQMLTQAAIAKEAASAAPGALVMVVGSDIYVYDSASGIRLSREQFRADRASGFYELTAISHIGPALAYLAQIKANGDPRWKARLASLQAHVAQVRALNRRAASEMLSNTVAFWMVQELANKSWDPAAVDVPGLTIGFPAGMAGYPAVALK